jgi:hypothetical protein
MGGKTWTRLRRRALEAYVADLVPRMRLADWTVEVSWEPAAGGTDPSILANITPCPSSRHVTIRLGPEFLNLSAAGQTQVLIHELVHCHLFGITDFVDGAFDLLEPGQKQMADVALTQHVELTVDLLADTLEPFMPVFDVEAVRPAVRPPRRPPSVERAATLRPVPNAAKRV